MPRVRERPPALLDFFTRAFGREQPVEPAPCRKRTRTARPAAKASHQEQQTRRDRQPSRRHEPAAASSAEERSDEEGDANDEYDHRSRTRRNREPIESAGPIYSVPDAPQRLSRASLDSAASASSLEVIPARPPTSSDALHTSRRRRRRPREYISDPGRRTVDTVHVDKLRRTNATEYSLKKSTGQHTPRPPSSLRHDSSPFLANREDHTQHARRESGDPRGRSLRETPLDRPLKGSSLLDRLPTPPASPGLETSNGNDSEDDGLYSESDTLSRKSSAEKLAESPTYGSRRSPANHHQSVHELASGSILREQSPIQEYRRSSEERKRQTERHAYSNESSRSSSRLGHEVPSDEQVLPTRPHLRGETNPSGRMSGRDIPNLHAPPEPRIRESRRHNARAERHSLVDGPPKRRGHRESVGRTPYLQLSRLPTKERETRNPIAQVLLRQEHLPRRQKHTDSQSPVQRNHHRVKDNDRFVPSKSSKRSPPAEAPKPVEVKLYECIVCLSDDIPRSKSTKLKCGHRQCQDCLKRLFKLSVKDPQHMPPKCCTAELIPLKHVEKLFNTAFKETWNSKFQEFTTRNRIYCPGKKCGEWIKPGNIKKKDGYGKCGRCKMKVCTLCNGKWHGDKDCPKDEAMNSLLEAAKQAGWQRCYSCRTLVELKEGCNHMTCRCTAEFCMICGLKWKSCNCPWFNYEAVEQDRLRHMQVPAGAPFFPRGGVRERPLLPLAPRERQHPARAFPEFPDQPPPRPRPPPPPRPLHHPDHVQQQNPPLAPINYAWFPNEASYQASRPQRPQNDDETERRRTRQDRRQRREHQLEEERRLYQERAGHLRQHPMAQHIPRPPDYDIEYTLDGLARSVPAADQRLQEIRDHRIAQLLQQRLWLQGQD